tara:strand:+ start:61 stop:1203 length:1143 start_codon:yes stop_codon:yes gene_type:complete
MSTLKVSKIEPVSSGGDCIVNATNIVGNKNLIINGAMEVAQRGTSTTTHNTLCVDRFKCFHGGTDEAPTFAQVALTSSDTGPWAKGFRKALQITNGNQTGGAGAADEVDLYHQIEAQNIASSGWDYTSSSSYITLSYWVKSSVAQNFYGYMVTSDGTNKMYLWETGSLTANTWTKITKKIPGASGLQFDSDNGVGLGINFGPFWGSDYTTSNATLGSWGDWAGTARNVDNTTTWYTTNDATFAITGVQLEVGDVATAFEHRTYADHLAACQRYYFKKESDDGTDTMFGVGWASSGSYFQIMVFFPVTMRIPPSALETSGTPGDYRLNWSGGNNTGTGLIFSTATKYNGQIQFQGGTFTDGQGGYLRTKENDPYVAWSAEF